MPKEDDEDVERKDVELEAKEQFSHRCFGEKLEKNGCRGDSDTDRESTEWSDVRIQ